jgi:hypothetical protein
MVIDIVWSLNDCANIICTDDALVELFDYIFPRRTMIKIDEPSTLVIQGQHEGIGAVVDCISL